MDPYINFGAHSISLIPSYVSYKFNEFILKESLTLDPTFNPFISVKLNGFNVIQEVLCLWMVRMDHKMGPTTLSLTVIWWWIDAHEYFSYFSFSSLERYSPSEVHIRLCASASLVSERPLCINRCNWFLQIVFNAYVHWRKFHIENFLLQICLHEIFCVRITPSL